MKMQVFVPYIDFVS